jgi:hypothetical protein
VPVQCRYPSDHGKRKPPRGGGIVVSVDHAIF